jgi:vacuolar-type H+-ATPase subunit C/Vma6
MMIGWEDVDARARGLASRLLTPQAMAALRDTGDLRQLAQELSRLGAVSEEVPGPKGADLELALRREAARPLRVLRRWLGPRLDVVAVALDAEDRRSLRALVRGAAAGMHADARLAGLMPTPTLPEGLLRELAAQSSIRDQALLLVAAGHPTGQALLAAATVLEPDLFAVELAIARAFAARAVEGARRDGRYLRTYVGDLIDAENCRIALLLAGRAGSEPPGPVFIAGGRRLGREPFERAASAGDPASGARLLGSALKDAEMATLLSRHADEPAALEAALDARENDALVHEARLDPLGPAPLLLYLRRLRAQTVLLGELVWERDLEAAP